MSVVGVLALASPVTAALDTSAFGKLATDPPPPETTRGLHFIISNEKLHDLFEPSLRKISGGVMVGVGAEQMYLYAAWANPDVLVPMDFDQVVVDLHHVYGAFFKQATTPGEMIKLWGRSDASKAAAQAVLQAAYPSDKKRRKRIISTYEFSRTMVYGRLHRLQRGARKSGVDNFISDPGLYARCRGLWSNGRVFPVRGDLTGPKTMKSIGAATKAAGLTVNTLYLSNAEEYFHWSARYRDNIRALPFGDKTLILRTNSDGKSKRYHYYVQSGANFRTWVEDGRYVRILRMVRQARATTQNRRLYVLDKLPRR